LGAEESQHLAGGVVEGLQRETSRVGGEDRRVAEGRAGLEGRHVEVDKPRERRVLGDLKV